jgi:hypothetical protein
MKCKICDVDQSIRSIAMHLKYSHNLSTDQYVEIYGEFRPKKINEQNIKKSSKIECNICNIKMMHNRQLMHHITKHHKDITHKEYIIKHTLNNIHPTCKCGCGEKTEFIKHGKDDNGKETYFREYIKGHWDWVKPNWIEHSHDTKMKMREIKIEQIKQNPNYFEKISLPEIELQQFISEYYNINLNDREILHGKEIDILIPEIKTAIEFNGVHFHSDKFKPKQYHLNKTKECERKGYRLIHIWECDWKFKQDIIKSNILNIINKTPNKIYARKCVIKEITRAEASSFYNINHIQGYAIDKIRIGLYYENKLVSVMTFSNIRKNLGGKSQPDHYELLRFCNILNTTVIGGASKLFKYFINKYQPKYIVSYANRDWSIGNLYIKLGFTLDSYTSPGYFYCKSKIKYNRFNFRKDILIKQGYDPNKTEYEIMTERGYDRIWNCGNIKFNLSL